MNFNEILKAVKAQQESKNVHTMHNQTEIISGSVNRLEKHEMKPFKTSLCIFPKELQLPFNPVDPLDDSFNASHKFIVQDAPTNFVKSLKEQMRKDEVLHKFYASLLKKTTEEYDVSTDEITSDDFTLFNAYAVPAHFSAETQKLTTAECGKFGTERLSPLEKDEDGNLVNADEYLIGRLFLLEREIRNEKIAQFYLDNDKASLTSDQKSRLDTIRRSTKITYPKKSGIALFLEFPGKAENGDLVLDTSISNQPLESFFRYFNCNSDTLKKLIKKLGKKRIDKYLDYIMLKVEYGDGVAKDTTLELALYNSREYEGIEYDSSEDPHTLYSEPTELDNKLTALFSDGLAGSFEKMIKKSVWKFRPISDNELRELYVSRLQEITPYITEEIYINFGDVIESISLKTKKELDAASKAGTLRVSASKIITIDENTTIVQKQIEQLDTLDTLEAQQESSVVDDEIAGGEELEDLLN